MADAYGLLIGVHVAAGVLALAAGAGALVTEKGGRTHRRFGRGFVYSLAVVSATAIAVLAFGPTVSRAFLSLVAVFSFYFAFSGYRVLSRKRPGEGPTRVDRATAVAFVLASAGLAAFGGWLLYRGSAFGVVLLVFGGIGLLQGRRDLRFEAPDDDARWWFFEHLGRMCAAYIAVVTATSAVNLTALPTVVRWLWPTAVGVPAILLLQRRYRARFRGDAEAATS